MFLWGGGAGAVHVVRSEAELGCDEAELLCDAAAGADPATLTSPI